LRSRLFEREVNVSISESIPLVPMDSALIVQVLVNLIENAIKYSPPQASIDIKAQMDGSLVHIDVLDQGPGISPEDLERVFTKFYRANKPAYIGGTGLGLSICRGIVEAHGGQIFAHNRPDGGAIFTFTLPANHLSDSTSTTMHSGNSI
jgi:two-component system sensor histidine kinase KdpD